MDSWNRSQTIGLARMGCPKCQGLGLVRQLRNNVNPCPCVLRAIFKACFNRFRLGLMKTNGAPLVNVALDKRDSTRRMTFGWKEQEYAADFVLISKRTLTASEYQLFRYAYLLGDDGKLCQRYLKISPSQFNRACADIEAKLGHAFQATRPYGLFPVDGYFSPSKRGTKVTAFPAREQAPYITIRPPLAA